MNALTQSSAAIIRAYLKAVIRKDASAVDRYFDPHVEYMVNGLPSGDKTGVLPPSAPWRETDAALATPKIASIR